MSMIGFPLLLIPFAVVNIIVFLMPGVSLGAPVYTLLLPSGASWTIAFSDVLLAFAMLLLFFEVVKAARPGAKYFMDHLLSFLVFAGAAAEFAMLPPFANSTFFLLIVLAFVDFIAGVAIRMRRPKAVAMANARAEPPPQREPPVMAPRAEDPAPVRPPERTDPPLTPAETAVRPAVGTDASVEDIRADLDRLEREKALAAAERLQPSELADPSRR
jgi:hypothetical protein